MISKCSVILFSIIVSIESNRIYRVGEQLWKVVNSNQSVLLEAKVPGGIYSEVAHNLREYMFYEFNDIKFRWIAYENWTYFTDFELKSSDLTFDSIHLVLHGADTVSEVYVNNNFIGSTTNMFVRYRFNIKPFIKIGINSLYVNFTSPVLEGKRIASLLPYKIPSECWPTAYHGECQINKLRKMQASFAWDWGPAFPSVGLWKPVEIELTQGTVLRSVGTFLTTEENDWRLTVRAWFDIKKDVKGILRAELMLPGQDSITSETSVIIQTPANEGRTVLLVPKDKVAVWWPNGYGSQTLYDLKVSFEVGKETLSKTVQTGFRTVEVMQKPVDEDESKGRSFYISVNGIPIFAKGSNWIPSDIFPENTAIEERVSRLLEAAVDANFNMLRVWGGGVYESDLFYKLCDKFGILIWHDLMFACNMYPTADGFLESVKTEVVQQVQRLQHHPSIANWAGNNENEVALVQNWYDTVKNFSLYRADYIKLYIETIKPLLESLDPQRPYLSSSPSNGDKTIEEGYVSLNPQNNLYGDVHYYNYLGNLWDWREFPIPRFASEYGVQSLPAFSTLLNAINITNAVWGSDVLQWKQHAPTKYVPILFQLQLNLPSATELKDIIYLSQINQAMSIKTETEHYRRLKSVLYPNGEGLTMGALYWQLNDVWEAPSWSSIDYLGNWKMLHYYAKSFFTNVIVSPFLLSDDMLSIYIVSDLLTIIDKAILVIDVHEWKSFSPSSTQIHSIRIDSNMSKEILKGNLSYFLGTCTNKSECFLSFTLSLDANFEEHIPPVHQNYFFPVPLKNANFQWAKVEVEKFIPQSKFEGTLFIKTDNIALFVWIECLGARGESGIKFSENGFHMVEMKKTIKVISKFPLDAANFIARLKITNLRPMYP